MMMNRSAGIHQRHVISKEMLQRLEAERQREILDRVADKQRQVNLCKQQLADQHEQRIGAVMRYQERARQRIAEQTRRSSSYGEEATTSKQQAADIRKAAMKAKVEDKKRLFRLKQLRAKLRVLDEMEAANQAAAAESNEVESVCPDANDAAARELVVERRLEFMRRVCISRSIFHV